MRGHLQAALIAVFCGLFFAQPAQAQFLEALKIGDDAKLAVAGFGPPNLSGSFKDYRQWKWKRPNGNDISISAKSDLEIAYIELDWGGIPDGAKTDMFDFVFGQTSLADIRKKLGSNGMAFRQRAASAPAPTGVVLLNSYDVGGVVVTFYSVINAADKDKALADEAAFASFAKLEAISLASDAYAQENWGERIYDPNYKKVEPY
jgi:hypothetical protein